ncbi:hypothetical protein ACFWJT_20355 [Streptomyces sp. NPDC127069]|uniref:hypothetical protein n=1 Tax=Streptomyces sp. NPDC127069 TaxID=3347128 RepID=UPI00364AB30F
MSYNQPGPYGQQPQQPGPYGQQPPPPPNPYGQQPQQPAYGYPQQAPPPAYPQPTPPPGYPQQGGYQTPPAPQPAYGYQQQPPQQGYMPPPAPPKKSKAGPIIAVIAVVAVIGGAGWWFLGGSGGSVSDATKGYKLVAPPSVGEFQQDPKYKPKDFTDKDKQEAEAAGVKNAAQVGMDYVSGDPKNPLAMKVISFNGVYGDIADPEKTVDGQFAAAKLKLSKDGKSDVQLIGSPKEMTPAGFKGAVMKCQEVKATSKDPSTKGPKEATVPICIWADYSTAATVTSTDVGSLLTGKPGYTLEQNAEFTAKLYNTARVKK